MDAVFSDADVMRFGDGPQSSHWVRSWIAKWVDEYYSKWGFGFWAAVAKETSAVIGYQRVLT